MIVYEQTDRVLLADVYVPTPLIQSDHSVWLLYDTRFYSAECLESSEATMHLGRFLMSLISRELPNSPHHDNENSAVRLVSSTPYPRVHHNYSGEVVPVALSYTATHPSLPVQCQDGAVPQEYFPSADTTDDMPHTSISSLSTHSNSKITPCQASSSQVQIASDSDMLSISSIPSGIKSTVEQQDSSREDDEANSSQVHVASDSDIVSISSLPSGNKSSNIDSSKEDDSVDASQLHAASDLGNGSLPSTVNGSANKQSLSSNVEEKQYLSSNVEEHDTLKENDGNVARRHRYSNRIRSKQFDDPAIQNNSVALSEVVPVDGEDDKSFETRSVEARSSEASFDDAIGCSSANTEGGTAIFFTPPQALEPTTEHSLKDSSEEVTACDMPDIPGQSVYNTPQSMLPTVGQEERVESCTSIEMLSVCEVPLPDTHISVAGVIPDAPSIDIPPWSVEESGLPSPTSFTLDQSDIDDCILPPPLSFNEGYSTTAELDVEQPVLEELVTTTLQPYGLNVVVDHFAVTNDSTDVVLPAGKHSSDHGSIDELSPICNGDIIDSSEEEKYGSFDNSTIARVPFDLLAAHTAELKTEPVSGISSSSNGSPVSPLEVGNEIKATMQDSQDPARLSNGTSSSYQPPHAPFEVQLPTSTIDNKSVNSISDSLDTTGSESAPSDASPVALNYMLVQQPKLSCKDLSTLNLKLEKQSEISLCLSHIESPQHFFAFPVDHCSKDILELESSLQDCYSRAENLVHFEGAMEKGWLCCAEIEEESTVYMCRGVVIDDHYSTEGECISCTVFALDYGHTNVVNMDKIFVLDEKFTTLPVQCICCSLDGVIPKSNALESLEKSPRGSPSLSVNDTLSSGHSPAGGKSADTSGYVSSCGSWRDDAKDTMKSLTWDKKLIGVITSCQGTYS